MSQLPLAYLLTWTCYGQWLHGDERGSVNIEHNQFGEPWLAADANVKQEELTGMDQQAYRLDEPRRRIVLEAIQEVCRHRQWTLHAAHVRAHHVHVVVSGDATPEKMMN